ncbi:MAG: hypothetical protein P0S96_05010 [Simkaniaceae bacterium]|nr:hypothetical protein [Candidatus Sacchlamyda saccharinae]
MISIQNFRRIVDISAGLTMVGSGAQMLSVNPKSEEFRKISDIFMKADFAIVMNGISSFISEITDSADTPPAKRRAYQVLNVAMLGYTAFLIYYAPIPDFMVPNRESVFLISVTTLFTRVINTLPTG